MTKSLSQKPDSGANFLSPFSQPYLLLVLAPMFWGGNIIAGKLAVNQVDPFLLVVARWFGATLLVLTFALPHLKRDWSKIRPPQALGLLFFYGVFGFASFNLLMYSSAYFTAGVNASIEQAAIPVLVLIGNFLVFRVRALLLQVVGVLLTVIGVIWVATHGAPTRIFALEVNIGDGMVLLACFLYATYSLTLRFKPETHWASFILVTSFAALLTSLVFQAAFGGGLAKLMDEIPATTPLGWMCVFYVMIFPSILAQLCYARGVELVGPNRASIFINLLPVFGTILSVIILGEGFESYHFVAAALVVCGIGLSEWAARRRHI